MRIFYPLTLLLIIPYFLEAQWISLTIPTTKDIRSSTFISDNEGWIGTQNSVSDAIIWHTASFSLQANSQTTIELFDLAGRKIETLLDKNLEAGDHNIQLDRGLLSAGAYFVKSKVNGQVSTKKIIIE